MLAACVTLLVAPVSLQLPPIGHFSDISVAFCLQAILRCERFLSGPSAPPQQIPGRCLMSATTSLTKNASQHALHLLYRDHHGWLTRWLSGRLHCSEQVADIAQDTYLRILIAPQLMGLQKPRAFLVTVAKGLLVDHFRRSALERAYLEQLALMPADEQPPPEQRLQILEALFEVDRLLAQLSQRARTAFLLDRIDGMPQAQIAQQLGVSVRRVRQYLAQAMRCCYIAQFGVDGAGIS